VVLTVLQYSERPAFERLNVSREPDQYIYARAWNIGALSRACSADAARISAPPITARLLSIREPGMTHTSRFKRQSLNRGDSDASPRHSWLPTFTPVGRFSLFSTT
jgi:hypothetical protein